jgi:hypothetical protein
MNLKEVLEGRKLENELNVGRYDNIQEKQSDSCPRACNGFGNIDLENLDI